MMKKKEQLEAYQKWVRQELARSVDFWLKNGMDHEYGCIYNCLDRMGKIYSTHKSVWMQGRCGWTFAYLSHVYGAREKWMEASRSCLDFMEKYCINRKAGNRMYFTVTADGKPCASAAIVSAKASIVLPMQNTMGSPARWNA